MSQSDPIAAAASGAAPARALIREGRFAEAEIWLLEQPPASEPRLAAEHLYTLAVAQRYQHKSSVAAATLRRLCKAHPEYSRAYQEQGHLALAANRLADAQLAYEQAVRRNPALTASWRALINLYELQLPGDPGRIQPRLTYAQTQLDEYSALPAPLASVASLYFDGALARADELCREYLRRHKTDVDGMRWLARIGEALGVLPDAEFLLATATELAPDHNALRYDYANLLLKMQNFDAAYRETTHLLQNAPDSLAFRALHGNALSGLGRYEEALAEYDAVLAVSERQPAIQVMRGHALKTSGRYTDAISAYQAATLLQPDHGDAWWSLANTKAYLFTDAEIGQMVHHHGSIDTAQSERIHLGFALGKAYEDRDDATRSIQYYLAANALKKASIRHQPEYVQHRADRLARFFTSECFERFAGVGCQQRDPVFIVGLPRAGSTLLEQILASHSQIDGTHELASVPALAQRLRRHADGGFPDVLADLDSARLAEFGRDYIDAASVYRSGAALFIDKNPNNFFHIGLIRLMLPNARVIDARRHPMACCFSGFKQLFGQGQEFSYDLYDIGDYYRRYVDLMAHWDTVLPGFVLRVQHEDVVDALEVQVRRLLDFLDLEFEPQCLEFHRTRRSIRTPSSEQVRQPIYRSGLDTWRSFEPWLDPLKRGLGEPLCRQYAIDYPEDSTSS